MPDQVRHDGQSLGTFLNYDTLCLAGDQKGQINHESKKLYRDSKPSYYSFTAYSETTHQAVTSWIGLALSTRAIRLGVCNAAQISFLRCTFSQKSAVLPNTLASIKAVSTVTDRLLLQISLIVRRLTPIAVAN